MHCFLGLTATATEATAASVAKHLGIPADDSAVIRGAAIPSNLYLSVSCDRDRDTVSKYRLCSGFTSSVKINGSAFL